MGFKRWRCAAEAARIAGGVVDAAACFASYRLPELYAGVKRRTGTFPVQYLGANVPQAWAAGTVFLLLQALLGLRADAPNRRLYVDPELPDFLPDLTLSGLRVGRARLDLRAWRDGDRTAWDAAVAQGDVEVRPESWRPWLA